MQVSFSILLLGLWLSRQCQICTGQYDFHKPSIFVSFREVVSEGTVTIYCIQHEGFQQKRIFRLYKVVNSFPYFQREMLGVWTVAAFPIAKSDQESYVCNYCLTDSYRYCSEYSDIVSLKIIGEAQPYPKPSITVIPSGVVTVGQKVTIHCENQGCPQSEFILYKEEPLFLYFQRFGQKALQRKATFFILSTQRSSLGIYRCIYCCQSNSNKLCSDYSDPVHINMRDPNLPKPSIKARPREQISLGCNVTMECWAPESDLNFFLYNSSGLIASQVTKPNRNRTEFLLFMVRLEDSGNYTCQYHRKGRPFLWSEPSDPVQLLVTSQKQGVTEPIGTPTILLASVSAGLLLLLLLLLLAFVLCRKRRKGVTTNERNQPVDPPIELNPGEVTEPDEITYAELRSCSFNTKQAPVPDRASESCVYAKVAQDISKARQ